MTSDPVTRFVSERTARLDRRRRLRPMSSREMTDTAIQIFQTMGWTMLRLSAVPALFCLAAIGFVTDYFLPHLSTTTQTGWVAQVGELAGSILIGIVVAGPLYFIGAMSISCMVSQIVSDYLCGNVPDEETAKRALRSNLSRLLVLAGRELLVSLSGLICAVILLVLSAWLNLQGTGELFTGLIAGSAVLAFIVGGGVFIYVRDRHSLASVIMVIEGQSAKAASRRSSLLRKGPNSEAILSQTFNLMFLSFVAVLGFAMVAELLNLTQVVQDLFQSLPYTRVWIEAFNLFPVFLVIWFVLPIWSTLMTIYYYDRRIRLEGFDIDALAGDIWRADQVGRFQL